MIGSSISIGRSYTTCMLAMVRELFDHQAYADASLINAIRYFTLWLIERPRVVWQPSS